MQNNYVIDTAEGKNGRKYYTIYP